MQFTLWFTIGLVFKFASSQIIRGGGNEWPLRCGHPQNDPKNHVSNLFDKLITRMTANKTEMAFELVNPGATATHITMCNDSNCSMMQGVFDEELIGFFNSSKVEIYFKNVAVLPGGRYQVNCEAIFIQELIVYAMKLSAVWVHGESGECADYVLVNMTLKDMRCAEDSPLQTSSCPYSTSFAGAGSTSVNTISTDSTVTDTATASTTSTMTLPLPIPEWTTVGSPVPIINTVTQTTSVYTTTVTDWVTITQSLL